MDRIGTRRAKGEKLLTQRTFEHPPKIPPRGALVSPRRMATASEVDVKLAVCRNFAC